MRVSTSHSIIAESQRTLYTRFIGIFAAVTLLFFLYYLLDLLVFNRDTPSEGVTSLLICTVFMVHIFTSFYLIRFGNFYLSVAIFVWGGFIETVGTIVYLEAGFYSPLLYFFFFMVVCVGYLLDSRHLFWMTLSSCAAVIYFFIFESVYISPDAPPPLDHLIMALSSLGLTAFICQKTLVELIHRSHELEGIKNNLEELVDHRTAELEEALDKAEAANKAKSAFLATMSHELRTPLNAIIGYTEITLEELVEADFSTDSIHDVQRIGDSGRHLLSLINTVLDLSRIEAGESQVDLENVDIRGLIDVVDNISRPLADRRCANNWISNRKIHCCDGEPMS